MRIADVMIFLLLISSCSQEATLHENDTLLAKISDKQLYLSDIASLIPENSSSTDSANIIRAYTENWARETVILLEAENEVAQDIDIDVLVKNYRESLLKHNFEKRHIEENLETQITMPQIEAFYNENKDHFVVTDPILKCWIAKVKQEKKGLEAFYKNMRNKKEAKVKAYCQENAEFSIINNEWLHLSEVKLYFPEKIINRMKFHSKFHYNDNSDGYEYFIQVFKMIKAGDIAPLEMEEENIKKLILHQRRTALLNKYREDLYEKNLKNKKVEFYIQ